MAKYTSFDKKAFESEVMRDVAGVYHEINPVTIFSEATDKIGGDEMAGIVKIWDFTTKAAKMDCMKYIVVLANRAFAYLCNLKDAQGDWLSYGALEAELEAKAHESGCHVDLNRGQYIQLRRLMKVEKTLNTLLGG
jgi:hypothetical protein